MDTNQDKHSPPLHAPSTSHAAASSTVAKEHSDERFADRDRRVAHKASMMSTRSWTIASVIAVGTILWLVFTR
jgi:hypothetical protein